MKKRIAKLSLTRESLRALDGTLLSLAARGSVGSDRSVAAPTLCDPSGDSQCDTVCLACPEKPPTIEN